MAMARERVSAPVSAPAKSQFFRLWRPLHNRKNALFAGHDAGASNWGVIASLIETCKLNSVDPHAYLADTFTAIVAGHKQSQINDLLPWNYAK
jgi:hypothetical protein